MQWARQFLLTLPSLAFEMTGRSRFETLEGLSEDDHVHVFAQIQVKCQCTQTPCAIRWGPLTLSACVRGQGGVAILVLAFFWLLQAKVRPYPYLFQNQVESGLFGANIVFISLNMIYTAERYYQAKEVMNTRDAALHAADGDPEAAEAAAESARDAEAASQAAVAVSPLHAQCPSVPL